MFIVKKSFLQEIVVKIIVKSHYAKERVRQIGKKKLKTDKDYRENRANSQRKWREKNSEYSKKYRATHQAYTLNNTLKQKIRNTKRKKETSVLPQPCPTLTIANTDVRIEEHLDFKCIYTCQFTKPDDCKEGLVYLQLVKIENAKQKVI